MADKFRIYQGETLIFEGVSPLGFKNELRIENGFSGPLSICRIRGTKESRKVSLPALVGKKMVCFGDSITYYDSHAMPSTVLKEWAGVVMQGYETYLRNALGGTVENQGIAGNTTAQIAARSKAFDFTGYEMVTFYAGVNDFSLNIPVGQVVEIGGSFDLQTMAGNYQSMIEDVVTRFPKLKVGIILPYQVWKNSGTQMPETYINVTKEIAKLYAIPYIDLYNESGINKITRSALFVDNVAAGQNQYHVNNHGYDLIGTKITTFVKGILGD
ncbi:SGNH/GDSL hydrolase family protein [Enterococcus faecalis]|nr:hypothetical protein A6B47_08955 [Enterococcus faecalis]TGY24259.1 SGNH/GDSL hydrolase family protein [Enterococcus faecalis]